MFQRIILTTGLQIVSMLAQEREQLEGYPNNPGQKLQLLNQEESSRGSSKLSEFGIYIKEKTGWDGEKN